MLAPTSFFADYGCHVRILEEARVLKKLGHEVTVVTYHNGGPAPDVAVERTLPIPWRRDYEVGSSRHKVVFDILLGLKTVQLLARRRFDLIHAHLHEGALIALVLGRLFRKPVLFDFQGSMTGEMVDHHFLKPTGRMYKLLFRLERRIDRAMPQILTSSAHARTGLIETFGCDPARITVLPDAVNPEVFLPKKAYAPEHLQALRASLGIPAEHKLIVYLGLLAEYQGVGLLLEAMQQIVGQRPDTHLLIMGFPNLEYYRQRAEALGIAPHVTFTGRMPYSEAPAFLVLGDVAVAPKLSMTEGAGKLLNYMSVALPTVAFDTPVAREYLGDETELAPAGDVAGLAAALLAHLNGDASGASSATGDRLRERATRLFSWGQAGQEIVTVYHRLCNPLAHTPRATNSPGAAR